MKAIRAHRFGGPDVLALDEVPRPSPGPGEALVRVVATAVNPVDWKLREGQWKDLALPFIPGGDFSGVVESVGPGVTQLLPGQEVFGVAPGSLGARAEFVVAPAATIAGKPRSLDHDTAAAVPLAALTAWQGLFDQGHLRAGEHVLVLGASGGVGSFAVQLAKNVSARVSGTASSANVQLVRDLGADLVVDHERERLEDAVKDVDLCLDLVGGAFQRRALAVIKKGGRLVSAVQPPDQAISRDRGIAARVFRMKPRGEQLRELALLIDAGKLRVDVAKVLPLEKASEAEELNRRRQVTGKIVLRVAA